MEILRPDPLQPRRMGRVSYIFQNIIDDYRKRWNGMVVPASTKTLADQVAKRLHSHLDRYQTVSKATGVPPAVLMCIHEREASGRFDTYLGNGQPLSKITTIVPKGRGPFQTWEAGAIDALKLDHLNTVSGWTVELAAYEFELYNGFGYRNKGVPSAYLWAGSNQYVSGKYVSDGKWDPNAVDHQLGAMVLLKSIFDLDPSLVLRRDLGGLMASAVPTPPPPDVEPKPQGKPPEPLPHGPIITGGVAASAAAGGLTGNVWWALAALVVVVGVAYLISHLKRKGT